MHTFGRTRPLTQNAHCFWCLLSDTPEEMDLLYLRQATAAEHAATEDSVPLMSPSLTREEYIDVLRRFHRVVSAWDRWADAHAPVDLHPLREGRRRATLLAQDLFALGETTLPSNTLALHQLEDMAVDGDPRAVFLGHMYVMEGSTLGGQYIARHVEETLGLIPGQGNAFFIGYGTQTAARWREFKAVLAALPAEVTDTVIASARSMFALFGEAMRSEDTDEDSQGADTILPYCCSAPVAALPLSRE